MGVQREDRRVSYNLIIVFVAFEQPFVVHTHYLSSARTFTLVGDVTACLALHKKLKKIPVVCTEVLQSSS